MVKDFECNKGDIVNVVLSGDETEYKGEVINPRKLWVKLLDYDSDFIADECNIVKIWKCV